MSLYRKCKIDRWDCVYHACMTDDCQKKYVLKAGEDWGPGDCKKETKAKNKKPITQ